MLVSVIIPCRNEEKFIEKCIESVIDQTYPKDKIEILAIDGMSEDKTREIIKSYSMVKLLDNRKKIFAAACNIGIKNAKGDLLMIIGAPAVYQNNYIKKCVSDSIKLTLIMLVEM